MGHHEKKYRKIVEKARVQKVWIPKKTSREPAEGSEEVRSDEFMRPSNVVKNVISKVTKAAVQNAFSPLDVDEL